MVNVHRLHIFPPLINSSSPWASDLVHLRGLYASSFTGAVTTRTSLLDGYPEDSSSPKVVFSADSVSSLNCYVYSPHPLSEYLQWVKTIILDDQDSKKPIIISVAAYSPESLASMLDSIQELRSKLEDQNGQYSRIGVEFNTSCPNIQGSVPISYDPVSLLPYLTILASHYQNDPTLTIGLKLPPYVHSQQFAEMAKVISSLTLVAKGHEVPSNPIAFVTCTNTLGTCMFLTGHVLPSPDQGLVQGGLEPALPTTLGGMGGESIHALSLGNVYSFSKLFATHQDEAVRGIKIIGVGGVVSSAAVRRMHKAGATVVACATILGKEGVSCFERLSRG